MNINYSYFFNKGIYFLFSDYRVEIIEQILKCKIVMSKGRYYPKYISYLVEGAIDETKIKELESILKHHIEFKYENYNYILKVFHQQLKDFYEYQYHKTKDMILGKAYGGLARIPINSEQNNYLIVGASGSGKSCLAQSIIYNLIHNNVKIVICDNKSSYDYDSLHVPLYKGVKECIKAINDFEKEIDVRQKENKRHEPYLLIIDEIFPFLVIDSKDKKKIYNQLALIMSKCRSVNCHVMIITQRATTDIIPSMILANINNRICLQTSSKQESINVLNCDIAFDINKVGRGYLAINGKLKEFQSYYLDKSKYKCKVEEEILCQDVQNATDDSMIF